MSTNDLQQRLAYFEERLDDAKRKHAAKEPRPRNVDEGYTIDRFKTWFESIALINEPIVGIKTQLSEDRLTKRRP